MSDISCWLIDCLTNVKWLHLVVVEDDGRAVVGKSAEPDLQEGQK